VDVVPFAQLTARVDAVAESNDSLDRVEAAVSVAAAIAGQADTLVDYFVNQARAAGRSWTEIGVRLGVSRQAARKRFVDTAPTVVLPAEVSLRPRLQACLAAATDFAQSAGAATVGAEHLLAGLLNDGVAATILDKLGVTADTVGVSTRRLFQTSSDPVNVPPHLSAEAVCAVEAAAERAWCGAEDSENVTVGTEHLLAVIALDHGSRAHRVLIDLGVDVAMVKKELACYLSLNPPKQRRTRRRRAAASCSFCGTEQSNRRPLAHGPHVAICGVCAERARQSIASRAIA
jgi:hypothetical protein